MALLFDRAAHAYYLDGPRVASTTGILRSVIRLDGVPACALDRARVRGAAVHALVHYDNEGDLDPTSIDPVYAPYLDAWARCRSERGIEPLLCEYRIASRRHRLAGTLDLLCAIAGEGWLLDYCTGNLDKLAKHLQTAGYLGMAYEWSHEDPRLAAVLHRFPRWRRAAVRLCRDRSYRFIEYTNAGDYARFLTLVAAHHIRAAEGAALELEDLDA